MAISTQVNKRTTISTAITSGTTTITLTSSVFSDMTSGYLVFDYDNPTLLEVIKCSISGSTVTVITRGQDGTSAQDHAIGAKVAWNLTKSDLDAIISGAEIGNTAWTAWTSTLGGFSGSPTQDNTYRQLGKTVHMKISISGTSNATNFTFTLPVAILKSTHITPGSAVDNGAFVTASTPTMYFTNASATVTAYKDLNGTLWTNSGAKSIEANFTYESV